MPIEEKSQILTQIKEEFCGCGPLFIALGEEVRQQIILALLDAECVGMNVNRITEQTHLSRPAVSHHLKVLKDAGIVQVRTQGTMNYYYLSPDTSLRRLITMSQKIERLLVQLEPDPIQSKGVL